MTGGRVRFSFQGKTYEGQEGEPLAVRLWALGIKALGHDPARAEPRGVYCAIGHCYECRLCIDGEADRRSCLTPLHEGLVAVRQSPLPPLGEGGDARG